MFRLTRCRRSDQAHFDSYTSLPTDLPSAICQVRARYGSSEDADLHLTISHKRRRAISMEKQARAAEGKICVEVPAGDDPAYPCFVGTRLIGSATGGKFINGARYCVKGIGPQVVLQDELTGNKFTASLEAVSRHTLLAWAMVYNKAQGCMAEGTVCLHDMASRYMRRSALDVGLSRVIDGGNVFIARE